MQAKCKEHKVVEKSIDLMLNNFNFTNIKSENKLIKS